MNKISIILIISLLLIMGVLLYLWRNSVEKGKEKDNLYSAIQDTLVSTRNKLGQQVSQIALIQQSSDKNFLALKTKDSTIITLQNEIKTNKNKLSTSGSITDIYSQTKGKFTGKTDSILVHDTVKINGVNYIYPEYKAHIVKDKWITADIISNKDSTTFSPIINNQYSVLISGTNKNPFVQVTNMNPYTTTSSLRAYQVINSLREKSWGLGFQIGYGIGKDKGVIITTPYIGIGISKNLLRW